MDHPKRLEITSSLRFKEDTRSLPLPAALVTHERDPMTPAWRTTARHRVDAQDYRTRCCRGTAKIIQGLLYDSRRVLSTPSKLCTFVPAGVATVHKTGVASNKLKDKETF